MDHGIAGVQGRPREIERGQARGDSDGVARGVFRPVMRRRDFLRAGGALPFLGGNSGKSCIVLKLTGGPSHLDTWDMKPDAPSGIRGPFRPIRTNVPGIEISEIFPRMARHAEK